jgi:hypothetical protein
MQLTLAVFPKSAAMIYPSEGTLDNPTLGQDLESMKLIALYHLNISSDESTHVFGEVIACVASVRQDLAHF